MKERCMNASEIGTYVFGAKAWQLSQLGAPSQNIAEQGQGIEWHAAHSDQVAGAALAGLLVLMSATITPIVGERVLLSRVHNPLIPYRYEILMTHKSVEGSQNGSFPLSLEGCELEAESSILDRHGRMTAEEESRKTKQEQDEGRHRPRFLGYMVMKVKPLSANRILANHII